MGYDLDRVATRESPNTIGSISQDTIDTLANAISGARSALTRLRGPIPEVDSMNKVSAVGGLIDDVQRIRDMSRQLMGLMKELDSLI